MAELTLVMHQAQRIPEQQEWGVLSLEGILEQTYRIDQYQIKKRVGASRRSTFSLLIFYSSSGFVKR
jgi:hypothetical protein